MNADLQKLLDNIDAGVALKNKIKEQEEAKKKVIKSFNGDKGTEEIVSIFARLHTSALTPQIERLRGEGMRDNPDFGRTSWGMTYVRDELSDDFQVIPDEDVEAKIGELVDGGLMKETTVRGTPQWYLNLAEEK